MFFLKYKKARPYLFQIGTGLITRGATLVDAFSRPLRFVTLRGAKF